MAMAWSKSSSNVISHPPRNRGRLQEVIEDQQRASRCRWRPIRRQFFAEFVCGFWSDQKGLGFQPTMKIWLEQRAAGQGCGQAPECQARFSPYMNLLCLAL